MEGRLELDLNWEQDLDNCWCCSQTLVVLEPAGHKSQHVLKQVPLLAVAGGPATYGMAVGDAMHNHPLQHAVIYSLILPIPFQHLSAD